MSKAAIRVQVNNLPKDFRYQDAKDLAMRFGNVIKVFIRNNPKGDFLGTAFFSYSMKEDGYRAIDEISKMAIDNVKLDCFEVQLEKEPGNPEVEFYKNVMNYLFEEIRDEVEGRNPIRRVNINMLGIPNII